MPRMSEPPSVAPVDTVPARLAPREPLRRLRYTERVWSSLWFVPALCTVGAYFLARLVLAIDGRVTLEEVGWLTGDRVQAASEMAKTVSTAMLAFMGVVFTTTLVAIQLAGGQYSPRVVRVFVRSRLTQLTLGCFLATFVFSLHTTVALNDREEVPSLTVMVTLGLLAATLVAFLAFLHGMTRMLRVQYLLTMVTDSGRSSVAASFPMATEYAPAPLPRAVAVDVLRTSARTGVVQAVDRSALVALAARHDGWLEVLVDSGEYLGNGTPVARLHTASGHALTGDDVAAYFLLGAERTLLHDPAFVFRQLVDIAIRALSPAVNDPTTAVQSIDRINDLLGDVCRRPDPTGWYFDADGVVRLRLPEAHAERLLLLGYVEIIRFGSDSPQVVRRLRAAFDVLDGLARDDLRPTVERLRTMLDEAVADSLPPAFLGVSAVPDRLGLG